MTTAGPPLTGPAVRSEEGSGFGLFLDLLVSLNGFLLIGLGILRSSVLGEGVVFTGGFGLGALGLRSGADLRLSVSRAGRSWRRPCR